MNKRNVLIEMGLQYAQKFHGNVFNMNMGSIMYKFFHREFEKMTNYEIKSKLLLWDNLYNIVNDKRLLEQNSKNFLIKIH